MWQPLNISSDIVLNFQVGNHWHRSQILGTIILDPRRVFGNLPLPLMGHLSPSGATLVLMPRNKRPACLAAWAYTFHLVILWFWRTPLFPWATWGNFSLGGKRWECFLKIPHSSPILLSSLKATIEREPKWEDGLTGLRGDSLCSGLLFSYLPCEILDLNNTSSGSMQS